VVGAGGPRTSPTSGRHQKSRAVP
ncbi:conserved hypothetical protein, partial [Burkholderia pseudomallei 1710a]